jgi:hypothetical protein
VNQILGISQELAHEVLWHYGCSGIADGVQYGIRPGGFKTNLFSTISAADAENRKKLAFAFPAEVAACELIEHHPAGVDTLRFLARGESRYSDLDD